MAGSLPPSPWEKSPYSHLPHLFSFALCQIFCFVLFCFKLHIVLQQKAKSTPEAGQNDAIVQGQFALISLSVQKDQG